MRAALHTVLAVAAACANVSSLSDGVNSDPELATGPWTEMLDGHSLGEFIPTSFGGEGEVRLERGSLFLPFGSPLTGVTFTGEFPTDGYELELLGARLSGTDFFCAVTFPVLEQHATFVLGGWGGSLTGISCVDGQDASSNSTRQFRHYETGRDYRIRVQMVSGRLRCFVDDELIVDLEVANHRFSLRPEVELLRPLGVASYMTTGRVRGLRYRRVSGAPGVGDPTGSER